MKAYGLGFVAIVCALYFLITNEQANSVEDRSVVCIEGVQYYMIREYQKGFMAPAYDPITLQVKTCTNQSR